VSVQLLVDLGNSRLKWAWSGPGEAWSTGEVLHRGRALPALLDEIWGEAGLVPDRVVVASVAPSVRRTALGDWVFARWGRVPTVIRAEAECLGVVNRYLDPASLGADRWAALIAVRGLTRANACVVDCGTAVTVDALSAEGEFLGGVILPGLDLMRESLLAGTALVRSTAGEPTCLGRATGEAVAGGTLYGLAGAIERVLAEQARALGGGGGAPVVFLTGGDAGQLHPLLRPAVGAQNLTFVPDLVLRGLERLVREGAV
jgi:type III pantothenate kinase